MKITIDEKECLKHKLTPEEVFTALAVRSSKDFQKTLDNLVNREVLTLAGGDKYMVTQRWSDELDEILCDSSGAIDDEDRLNNLAQKMRDCYPKGKMPGTVYYYRCNTREVVLKLKKFFNVYGNYTDDRIVDATKRFVASYNGNYKYLPLIKYFIMKNKTVMDEDGTSHISEVSPLADYLENKTDDNLVTASDDWLMTVRN